MSDKEIFEICVDFKNNMSFRIRKERGDTLNVQV